MTEFYRLFFNLSGDGEAAFEALANDAAAIEAAVSVCAAMWRDQLREAIDDPLARRQFLAMRALIIAARIGVRGSRSPNVVAAFAQFITDLTEQRVRALDHEENQDREDVPNAMSAGTFVEVRKVSVSARPMVEPSELRSWVCGSRDNVGALPVGYAMYGVLLRPVQVGMPIRLLRVKRNGMKAIGEFRSSNVVVLRPAHLVETTSSIYIVRPTGITSVQIWEES